MDPSSPSRTALVTALMRGLHARSGTQPIFRDTLGEQLVPDTVRAAIARRVRQEQDGALDAHADADALVDEFLRSRPAYAAVIMRSRYAEDRLHEAVARGVAQYVLIGAGLDTYALRQPAGGADLRVFEVDHPATQSYKLRRMDECGLARPPGVRFLAADLAAQRLRDVLARSDFDARAPAFFSWLGVTMYLTREANLAALADIRHCCAPGGELVFTYIDATAFRDGSDTASARFARVRQRVAELGEPMLCGFDPAGLHADLEVSGFAVLEDASDAQLARRYDPCGVHGLRASGFSRIAHVAARGH